MTDPVQIPRDVVQAEREAFEAWERRTLGPACDAQDRLNFWIGWQARSALSAPPVVKQSLTTDPAIALRQATTVREAAPNPPPTALWANRRSIADALKNNAKRSTFPYLYVDPRAEDDVQFFIRAVTPPDQQAGLQSPDTPPTPDNSGAVPTVMEAT